MIKKYQTKKYSNLIKIKTAQLKFIGKITSIVFVFLFYMGMMQYALAATTAGSSANITILPTPPENASAVHQSPTEIELTWDASPSPSTSITSYTIFYKLRTDPNYPAIAQITRLDSLANYSEVITVLPNTAYDFIIFANAASGLKSTENCTSCEASNAVCGNGLIEAGETCDSADLAGFMCTDFAYNSGNLACDLSCDLDFSGCNAAGGNSGGGGGGGGSPRAVDSTKPDPGLVVSPAYANNAPILVTYSGASDKGGSGFSHVSLFYKKDDGDWMNSGLISPGTEGEFNFEPDVSPSATYAFALQAHDKDGNSSSEPTDEGKTVTIYDTESPFIERIDMPAQAKGPIEIFYSSAKDKGIAGLDRVELWYREGSDGKWMDTGKTSSNTSDLFFFNDFNELGAYDFELVVFDKAGNRSLKNILESSFDTEAPALESIFLGDVTTQSKVIIGYQGAIDIGPAGLKEVELWYKKEENGEWIKTDLTNDQVNGEFEFEINTYGTYFFSLVLEDNFGNRSNHPISNGVAGVFFTTEFFEPLLSNLPKKVSTEKNTDIFVSGIDIVSYKYQVNGEGYSEETPISKNINLIDLVEGNYELEVLGKNSLGVWQDISNPSKYHWEVDFSKPYLLITGPEPFNEISPQISNREVFYQITYDEYDDITLTLNDIFVDQVGTATGDVTLTQENESTWSVIISDIWGEGSLSILVGAGTASHQNGNLTSQAGPSDLTTVIGIAPETRPSATDIKKEASQILISGTSDYVPFVIKVSGDSSNFTNLIGQCKEKYKTIGFDSEHVDTDNDGLSDRMECYISSNPLSKDTDNDGCLDGYEITQFGTNPLEAQDCRLDENLISIISPQSGWFIRSLDVVGSTSENIQEVHLYISPVLTSGETSQEVIDLGSINEFTQMGKERQKRFESAPETVLVNGQTYDLVAIGIMDNGQIISSLPIRFTLDSSVKIKAPTPISINEILLEKQNGQYNRVELKPTKSNKVIITGQSEYGTQVVAIWGSSGMSSTIVVDDASGHFSIESPGALSTNIEHKVILYSLKELDGGSIRSENIEVSFYIQDRDLVILMLILLIAIAVIILAIQRTWKRAKQREEKKIEKYLTSEKK